MSMSLTEALLKWMSSCFEVRDLNSAKACSNGVECARILSCIDSTHFSSKWKATIKDDIPKENVRLKANNIKKVLNGISEYYADVLNLQLSEFPMPDMVKVAEGDVQDTGRLLQLILGCAINCDDKQKYIESIMHMEETVQQVIMHAIQEIMSLQPLSSSEASLADFNSGDVKKLMDDLNEVNREREELKQKCHELENKVSFIEEEKANLMSELESMQKQANGTGPPSFRNDQGIMSQEHRKQMEMLQEELFKSETQKEELQARVELLEKQNEEAHAKEAELQKLADQSLKLKDELDILRETADKASKYEAAIDSYKKKLEELGDLRRQVKILEDKNTEYMQKNMELEENVKKTESWKPQVDTYKKQISELRAKVDSETKRADRTEFEAKKLVEKVETLSVERDRLLQERDELREKHEELVDDIKFGQAIKNREGTGLEDDDLGNLEMIPSSIKERLLRLQHENKRLKAAKSESNERSSESDLLQTIIDDLKEREKNLESENRKANQKIMELESKLDESKGAIQGPPRVPGSREELELKLSEKDKKINHLQESITKKDAEIHQMEERYKKYIEKAKAVIKTLDPKSGGQTGNGSSAEVALLRNQLNEKEKLIETLEQETEKARAVREMEERLLSSAFYNFSMQMHRSAVENRLSNNQGNNQQPGQSFLARQRQVNATRSGSGRGGYQSSDFLDY